MDIQTTRSIKIAIRVDQETYSSFQNRARGFKAKPARVLRALLRNFASTLAGDTLSPDLVEEEHLWERTRTRQSGARRDMRLYTRVDQALYQRIVRRAGEARDLGPVLRAVVREFCAGNRDVAALTVERELRWERNRRQPASSKTTRRRPAKPSTTP